MKCITPLMLGLLLSLTHDALAQAPAIQWQRCLGGSNTDRGAAVRQLADGGFIVAGTTSSSNGDAVGNHGLTDIWVGRLDAEGELIWSKCMGGGQGEEGNDVRPTADGGFIVAGRTSSNSGDVVGWHGELDAWVVKLNSAGEIEFQRPLGGTSIDMAHSVIQTTDGGYLIAGQTESRNGDVSGVHDFGSVNCLDALCPDAWVVKLDPSGTLEWQRALGGGDFDGGRDAIQCDDGGYILTGYTKSLDGDVSGMHGVFDMWVVKLDAEGTPLWQRCLGGGQDDNGRGIVQTVDGGFAATGVTASEDGDVVGLHGVVDMWGVKLDTEGALQWQHALGGTDDEIGEAIAQTSDGGIVIIGSCLSTDGDVVGNHGITDMWAVKLDAVGALEWQLPLGGSNLDWGMGVEETSDGGYILVGHASSENGNVVGLHGQYDIWVVKLAATVGVGANAEPNSFSITPQPAHDLVRVLTGSDGPCTLTFTDAMGRTVRTETGRGREWTTDLGNEARGFYTVTLRYPERIARLLLLLE